MTDGKPKTAAGERRLCVGTETAELRRHKGAQELERMLLGPAWQDNNLVFCREDGQPLGPGYVSTKWRELARLAGLPPTKLLAARHSAFSAMRDAGVDRDLRKVAVGHSADNVHDRYTHYTDNALRAAASQAEQHVTGRGER